MEDRILLLIAYLIIGVVCPVWVSLWYIKYRVDLSRNRRELLKAQKDYYTWLIQEKRNFFKRCY